MALIMPVLLFLVFAIIDFGRLLNARLTLTEAAREGARAAAFGLPATGSGSVDERVQKASGGLSGVVVQPYTACQPNAPTTADATVTIDYTFTFVTPLAGLFVLLGGSMSDTHTMTGKGVMPCAT
jgi:Flp pilus assembly protein TadG